MAHVLRGIFTINDVLKNTTASRFKSRYRYRKRDVVKRITIKRIKRFKPDRIGAPLILYQIESKSWPQYKPYFTKYDKRGRPRKYQRTIPHFYDLILELDELSISTSNWVG